MYRKICVPVDNSAASYHALDEALKLAKGVGATLFVLHVIDLTQFSWGASAYTDKTALQEAINATSDEVLKKAEKAVAGSGVSLENKVVENTGERVADIVLEEAEAAGCDMIAMGTHGYSGVMHLLMGSVAEGVMRKTKLPVLLVRRRDDA